MQREVELLTCLIPQHGFALECLVGTTYGLSPRIVLAILGYTLEAIDKDLDSSMLESAGRGRILAALRENMNKVLFIREDGQNLEGNGTVETLSRLIMDRVASRIRRSKTRGSLHSKFILAIYKNEEGVRYGRLYIGSRNFTSGTSRELGVVLELSAYGSNERLNKDLLSFMRSALLPELDGASSSKVAVIEKAIALISKHKLSVKDPDIRFFWQSRHTTHGLLSTLKEEAKDAIRLDLYSPWADPTIIDDLMHVAAKRPVHVKCLRDPRYSYPSRSNLNYHFDGLSKRDGSLIPRQSHAKAYLFSRGKQQILYFGSANLTASGLGIAKTINTEILLRWSSRSDFKELLLKGSGDETDGEPANPATLTAADKLQQELFSIDILIAYSEAENALTYKFINFPRKKIAIDHLLLEPLRDGTKDRFEVNRSRIVPSEVKVRIRHEELKKISSWVVLTAECEGKNVYADRIVELPPAFYDARSDLSELKAFRMADDQLIQELLSIADFPAGMGGGGGIGDGDCEPEQLTKWLERVQVERLTYRLFRMRENDPQLFGQRMRRLERVISELNKSTTAELSELSKILTEVSYVLAS